MSPRLQGYYQRALERLSARPPRQRGSRHALVVPKLSSRVVINGEEFTDPQEMPPPYRELYESILAQALPLDAAVYAVARIEHSSFIKRAVGLAVIANAVTGGILYLWLRGFLG